MAAPTQKATTSPYARYTITELRDRIAGAWLGKSYANLHATQQTYIDQLLNESYDHVDAEAFGHQEWCRRKDPTGITLVSGQMTYLAPVDFRRGISCEEGTTENKSRTLDYLPRHIFEDGYGEDFVATHPLLQGGMTYWSRWGFDNSEPPRQIIARLPIPGAADVGNKLYLYYRPHFNLIAAAGSQDAFVEVIPSVVPAVIAFVKMNYAADKGNPEQMALQERLYERQLKRLQLHEQDDSEAPVYQQLPDLYVSEIQPP